MITTGRLPIRAPGVDPGLPTDGRGNHEWRGFIKPREHPQGIVRSGVLNNWNNKPARGFPAADDQWSYGAIGRVDLLNQNTTKRRKHTLATLTGAMNAAATQDVRVMTFVPLLARVPRGQRRAQPARRAHARAARGLAGTGRQAGSTATSTGKSTIPARPSSTRPGTAWPTPRWRRRSASRWPTSSTTRCTGASTCRPAGSSAAGTCTCRRTCAA